MNSPRYRTPPPGWHAFGTHAEVPVRLEFSTELGEDGLPLWERPVGQPHAHWGAMYEDGSVRHCWNGRTERDRAEEYVRDNPYCILVRWVEGEWVEVWP
jgi:hypothetical protein